MENRRKYFRKPVYIIGDFIDDKTSILIKDLSMEGIKFEFLKDYEFYVGDEIKIFYQINKKPYTFFEELYIIKWMKGKIVGCSLLNVPLYQKSKGFFIRG